jgi:hypothetical protein
MERAHGRTDFAIAWTRLMRCIMLTVALMLWASQVEADALFRPDTFTLDVRAVFNDTGTDTFCWQCGDANPLNDF